MGLSTLLNGKRDAGLPWFTWESWPWPLEFPEVPSDEGSAISDYVKRLNSEKSRLMVSLKIRLR